MPSIAQPSDRDFEITFADLAHAQLRDKAPALLDYLLGFQVIDQNEDQTHGVGVMGFKVGEQMLFVPSFFLNGELKQSLIYVKNQDLFVPLQDNWVTYMLSRRPSVMGEPEPRKEQELGVMQPDYSALSNTQSGGTSAATFGTRQASWQDWTEGSEKMFANPRLRAELGDLQTFLRKTADYKTSFILLQAMRDHPSFGNDVLKFHKLSDLMHKPSCTLGRKPAKKNRKGYVRVQKRSALLFDADKDAAASDPDLVRILHGPAAIGRSIMPEADMERLMRGDIVVKDAREEANKAYRTDEGTRLTNPDQLGEYEMLLSHGEYADVCIIPAPRAIGKGYTRVCLVIDKDSKNFGYFWCDECWVKPSEQSKGEKEDYIDGLSSVSSMSTGSIYTIFHPGGNTGTISFKVKNKVTGRHGTTEFYVEPIVTDPGVYSAHSDSDINDEDVTQFGKGHLLPFVGDVEERTNVGSTGAGERGEGPLFNNLNHIVVTDDHRDIRVVRNTLFVPDEAKVLTLKEDDALNTWAVADPSSLLDVEVNLLKDGAQQFTVLRKKSSYYVEDAEPMNRLGLVTALIKRAGLRGDDAIALVDSLRDDKRERFLVKVNAMYAPPFPEPQMGYDDYAGVMEQYPQDELVNAPTTMEQNPEAYLNPPGSNLAENARNQMTEAANTGQQEIFDTSAIASLVRATNSDDLISQYLSDIILGLDRVNRILFMYYWKNEQFRDRYGQENMVELEDQLKDVSKGLGDLVLFLKQRQVEGSQSFDSMDIEMGAR